MENALEPAFCVHSPPLDTWWWGRRWRWRRDTGQITKRILNKIRVIKEMHTRDCILICTLYALFYKLGSSTLTRILTKWHNNATNIQTLSPRLCFRKKGKSFYICLFIVVANRISRYTTNVIIIINDKLINKKKMPSRCILRKYFLIINKTVDYYYCIWVQWENFIHSEYK